MNQQETNTEPEATPQEGGLPSTDLLCKKDLEDLYRRFLNAHYSMAADEWNENASHIAIVSASHIAIGKRYTKFQEVEKEFKKAIGLA